jgi:hypothetical protein
MIPIALVALLFILATLFAAEDRPHMKRIDASPALPDDGRWLKS